jgi:galactokinase
MPVSGRARWRAPGRVNLIGEHTDYNDGFALPFALQLGCTATVECRHDDVITLQSAQRSEPVRTRLGELHPGSGGWAGYALGAVWALREAGAEMPGLDLAVDSDVPVGSGLSSSAALVCSVTTAVDDALGLGLDAASVLAVSRRAENDFVGAPTGGMDQLVSLRGEPGTALLCDMRTLDTEPVALPLAEHGLQILVVDSQAEHRHSDGEYRQRREGCERAARELGVAALRDVGPADLGDALARLDDEELRRYVRHIVTENARVLAVADLLRERRLPEIGPLLTESHTSMRDDYRITIPELDVAVDTLLEAGALGARMTGGGFGGCVIALLATEQGETAAQRVAGSFERHGFRAPKWFAVSAAASGAHRA